MMIDSQKVNIPIPSEHNVSILKKGDPQRIYVLLHGYLQDGTFILDKLSEFIPDGSLILSPNGPFTVPVKKNDTFLPKYAWYFFDSISKRYYVDFNPAAHYICELLHKFNAEKLPVTVIGYSQGGYLAPKLAELIEQVDNVIGVACCFRNEKFSFNKRFRLNQVNSYDDLIVDFKGALSEFNETLKMGNKGLFLKLNGTGHRLCDDYYKEIVKLF